MLKYVTKSTKLMRQLQIRRFSRDAWVHSRAGPSRLLVEPLANLPVGDLDGVGLLVDAVEGVVAKQVLFKGMYHVNEIQLILHEGLVLRVAKGLLSSFLHYLDGDNSGW